MFVFFFWTLCFWKLVFFMTFAVNSGSLAHIHTLIYRTIATNEMHKPKECGIKRKLVKELSFRQYGWRYICFTSEVLQNQLPLQWKSYSFRFRFSFNLSTPNDNHYRESFNERERETTKKKTNTRKQKWLMANYWIMEKCDSLPLCLLVSLCLVSVCVGLMPL